MQQTHRGHLLQKHPPRSKHGESQTHTLRNEKPAHYPSRYHHSDGRAKSDKAHTHSPDPAATSDSHQAQAAYPKEKALFSTRRIGSDSMPTIVIEDQILAKAELENMLQSATKEVSQARRHGQEPDAAVHDYIRQLEEIINGLSD
jgi:hypothetical protein